MFGRIVYCDPVPLLLKPLCRKYKLKSWAKLSGQVT